MENDKLENEQDASTNNDHPEVIAITACPTGIAHTYMAKEKLEQAAKKLGLTYKIETQGRGGNENTLTSEDIKNAKVIIFAADKAVNYLERFNGQKVLEVSTRDAIFKGEEIIQDYSRETTKLTTIKATKNENSENNVEFSLKNFKFVTRNLLNGVSHMLPFVVAGGIILGIGYLLDSGTAAGSTFGTNRAIAGWFTGLGKIIFSMMMPVLGAYVCYSIVGAQGLLPGFICGLISAAPDTLYSPTGGANLWGKLFPSSLQSFNSGFFGAIIGAYLMAFVVYGLTKGLRKAPKAIRGVRDIVFIPVLTALGAGVLMFAINIPLGYLNYGLREGLLKMSQLRLGALAGLVIGIMMAADMGGPINKAAYFFGTTTLGAGSESLQSSNNGTIFMASAMLAGMVPPLTIAISTRIFKKYWSVKDVEGGNANWFLAACFITEGAIPYAAADPKRVIPSCIIGSGITGAITAGFGVTLAAPHGGVFVFPLLGIQDNGSNWFKMNNVAGSIGVGISIALIALFLGALVSAVVLGFWRKHDIKTKKLILA